MKLGKKKVYKRILHHSPPKRDKEDKEKEEKRRL